MDAEQVFPTDHGIRDNTGNIWWHCLFGTAEMERLVLDLGQGWVILLLEKKNINVRKSRKRLSVWI